MLQEKDNSTSLVMDNHAHVQRNLYQILGYSTEPIIIATDRGTLIHNLTILDHTIQLEIRLPIAKLLYAKPKKMFMYQGK